MARKDAFLKLHQSLLAKRSALLRKINEDLSLTCSIDEGAGDEADLAMDTEQHEIHSQLAALESRELLQIEEAIRQIRKGTYGTCESCQSRIPVSRLNALPFTTHCIQCQRAEELVGNGVSAGSDDWSRESKAVSRSGRSGSR